MTGGGRGGEIIIATRARACKQGPRGGGEARQINLSNCRIYMYLCVQIETLLSCVKNA